MLKRWMALCLIGLLALPFLGAAAAGDMIYTVFFEEDFEGDTPVSLAVFQNQLYALGAEGIYLLNPAKGTVRRLTDAKADITDPSTAFSGITHLFADKEGLLSYANDTKTLYRIHLNKTPVSKTPLLTIV